MCYMAHARSRAVPKAATGAPVAKRKPSAKATPTTGKSPRSAATGSPARSARFDEPARRPDVVGVRELRQNLSVYLDRVKKGEALQVTEHGNVVAVLRPVPLYASRLDILMAQGLITPATRSIRDLPPPRKAPPGTPPMSEILDELREDRF